MQQNDPFDIEKEKDKALLLEAIKESRSKNVNCLVNFYVTQNQPLKLICMGPCLLEGEGAFEYNGNYYKIQKTSAQKKEIVLHAAYEWLSDMIVFDKENNMEFDPKIQEVQQILQFAISLEGSKKQALEYIKTNYDYE